MNKKMERLMRPGMGWVFLVLVGFCGAALVMEYYALAAVEAVITVAILVLYMVLQNKRKKEIQDYVKKRTAPYKYPRIVEFKDSLPKTTSGKIIRKKL